MLTVLSVSYPLAAVGPDSVGGAEQVLCRLDAALTAAGHRSLVVGWETSVVRGTLVPTPAVAAPFDEDRRRAAQAAHREAIGTALRRWPVDLVHMHGVDFHACLPPPGVPVLATLHGPFWWYPPEALRPARPGTHLHCVSAAQRRSAPPGLDLLPDIPNGVDVEALAGSHAKRGFALCLGRICPEKGYHIALDAARRAAASLLLAGAVFPYPAHEDYYRSEIVPRLDRRRRHVGPLGFARKRRFLAAARCLVVPSLIEETGSLVAMEALAAGTPVVAFPNGALADVVEHGVTGFLVASVEKMADAIAEAGRLDPAVCRARARERFSAADMVAAYLAAYHRLAGRPPAAHVA